MPIRDHLADEHGVIRAGTVDLDGDRWRLARETRAGRLIRLAPGAYISAEHWQRLDADAQYRMLIRAAAQGRLRDDELVGGLSACALWCLPSIDAWPSVVHTVSPHRGGGRRSGLIVRHSTRAPDIGTLVDGIPTTTLARSVVDAAASAPLEVGVALADAALRGSNAASLGTDSRPAVSRDELSDAARRLPINKGRTRALAVAQFADLRAESPGESMLRVALHRIGTPPPELQVEFRGVGDRRYVVDFYWPNEQVVLEFDGRAKYLDPALRGGRSAEQVVYEEKRREDEIREVVRGFARVDWATARSLPALRARLSRAGMRW